MKRYNKNIPIGSKEYKDLLDLEIRSWSQPEGLVTYEKMMKGQTFQTYNKGIVPIQLEFIEGLGDNISVLELGSSCKWLSNKILSLPNVKEVYDIDIINKESTVPMVSGKRKISLPGDLNQIDKIPFDKKFNCIITNGTLHHLVDPGKTLEFCSEHLLTDKGIIMINDIYVQDPITIRINAWIYNKLILMPIGICKTFKIHKMDEWFAKRPHWKNYSLKENIIDDFKILWDINKTKEIAYAYWTSPFESISSYEDYKEWIDNKMNPIFFKELGSLGIYQQSYDKYPKMIKELLNKIGKYIIDPLDICLIKYGILKGMLHLSILIKKPKGLNSSENVK